MSKSTPPASKSVGTTEPHPEEQRARELLTQDPMFLGVDGSGAAHYWDSYEYAVAVVQTDASKVYHLDETACATLGEWCDHIREARGWDVGPRVGGSLVDDLRRGLER